MVLAGIPQIAPECGERRPRPSPRETGGALSDDDGGAGDHAAQVDRLAVRHWRHVAWVRWLALQVEQDGQHPHPAHSVGQGVVELQYQRRLTVSHALDQGELPQRPVLVEGAHRRTARQFQHRLPWCGAPEP